MECRQVDSSSIMVFSIGHCDYGLISKNKTWTSAGQVYCFVIGHIPPAHMFY